MPHTGQGFPTSPSARQPMCCSLPLTSSQRSCSCGTTPLPPALGYTGTFFRMVQLEPAPGGASNFSPCNRTVTVFHSRQMDTQLWCPPRHYCLESHHHKHTSSVPDRSGAAALGRQQAKSRQKEPLTYYFPQQNNILASHNKDASRDVPILLAHVDALHSLVQHQVCCSSQERERK